MSTYSDSETGQGLQSAHVNEILHEKIKWLLYFRVAVVTILLITATLIHFKESSTLVGTVTSIFFPLAGLVYFLSILYIPIIKHIQSLSLVAASQVIIDIIIVTVVVYLSGGMSSPLSFLYIFTIIGSAIISSRKGGYFAASLSSILYGALLNAEYYDFLPAISEVLSTTPKVIPANLLYNTTANIGAFYLVAFLSGYLALRVQKAEDELLEKKIDYQALEATNNDIVKNLSSGLLTVDMKGLITSFNQAAESITGYMIEEVYGHNVLKIFPDFKNILIYGMDLESMKNARWEEWFSGKKGATYYLGFSCSPLKDSEGKKVGEIIIFQDLTAFKNMEQKLKKADRLAALGKFAAGIAHEIRNPLASISGSVEMLYQNLGEEIKKGNARLVDIILREIARLNDLINEFLVYAKPSEPTKEQTDLKRLLAEIIEINSPDLQKKDIVINCQSDAVPDIPIDRAQIKQVLWNLLRNSADAIISDGEILIQMRYNTDEETVSIAVSDNGRGIPAENLDKIFDPFYTSKDSGAGLGLSIAHSIVEAHGGLLGAQSLPGEGATFTVTLPKS